MNAYTAKQKCKNFLSTLLRLAAEQPMGVGTNVRCLIQDLIDGRIQPEHFTNKLQYELNSSPQPSLVPFLKVRGFTGRVGIAHDCLHLNYTYSFIIFVALSHNIYVCDV